MAENHRRALTIQTAASAVDTSSRLLKFVIKAGFDSSTIARRLGIDETVVEAVIGEKQILSLEQIEMLSQLVGVSLPVLILMNVDATDWPKDHATLLQKTIEVLNHADRTPRN